MNLARNCQTTALIGAQWGDEGKGKISDILGRVTDCAVRFAGGNNAGHTVVLDDVVYKLNLLPSTVLHDHCSLVLANGMVIDPKVLLAEMQKLGKNLKGRLFISDRAHVITPLQIAKDIALDNLGKARGLAAGSTHRGIGPTYADKAARLGIRMIDLVDEETLDRKLRWLYEIYSKELKALFDYELEFALEELKNDLLSYGQVLADYIVDTASFLRTALESGQRVLFEGAQGAMLDLDFGLYPYNTSSNTGTGGIGVCTGLAPAWRIDRVIGVVKAYLSRVGEGHLPTEMEPTIGNYLRTVGGEFGTTTGRPRRMAWLDLVQLRHAHDLNRFTRLAITKLDVLTRVKEIKVCVAYRVGRQTFETLPTRLSTYNQCEPVYETFRGWTELDGACQASDLPDELLTYVGFIKKELGVPIEFLSVGADREQTIVVDL